MEHRCVQFVPFKIVHRAAFEMAEEQRKYEVWQDEFERVYNVRFGTLKADIDSYCMIFPNDDDYLMFMLKWA